MPSRDWYATLLSIHTTRADNLRIGELPTNRFDRKLCEVHEQFKFLIFSVCCFAFGAEVSSLSLPLDDDSLITHASSIMEEVSSSMGHERSAKRTEYHRAPYSLESQLSVNDEINLNQSPRWMTFKAMPRAKDPLLVRELPAASSTKWGEGLIWKGIYFRVLSMGEGLALASHISNLKTINQSSFRGGAYRVEKGSLICIDLALIELIDLGSIYLFASPVISSDTKDFITGSKTLEEFMPSESKLKVALEARSLAIDYQYDQVSHAFLHLLFLVEPEVPTQKVLGMRKEVQSSLPELKVLTSETLLSFIQACFTKIDRVGLKSFVSNSCLKSFKGHSVEST